MKIDPTALGEFLEQNAIETAGGAVIDVLDGGLMTQPGIAQPGEQALITPIADLAIEQQAEPFRMSQRRRFSGCFDLAEGLGHAVEAELMKQIEGWMGEQDLSPNCSSANHGCWGEGSARRPRGADLRRVDRACDRGWSEPTRR